MNDPARHLQSVSFDAATGEVCPNCEELQRQLDGAERDVRGWRSRYALLKADKADQAKHHGLFPAAKQAFSHWQIVCEHKRSGFTADRFWLIEPFLEDKERYGLEMVLRAIDGAAFQSWVSERTNGTLKLHNDWDKIFEAATSMEERVNRAPRGWTPAVSAEMEGWKRGVLVNKSWGGLIAPNGWEPPPPETDDRQIGLAVEGTEQDGDQSA